MSSKPRAGINHKVYGVTSEGVNVYLDVALRRVLGINPKEDSFTIKMTGGKSRFNQNATFVSI
jgi:glutamate dehydrogenase